MPEAIATTKRKLHKILDSITHTSQASLPTETTSSRPSPAEGPAERAAKRLRPSTSSVSLSTNHTRNTSTASLPRKAPIVPPKDLPTNNEPPNFSPWSHDAFLKRLRTFSNISDWRLKPDAISELLWAKRGWVCVGKETVACKGGCEKRVVVILERDEVTQAPNGTSDYEVGENDGDAVDDDAYEQAMVARHTAMIVHGHSESCLWRKASCKDDIYRLPVIRPSIWEPALRSRYKSLSNVRGSLENVTFSSKRLTQPNTIPAERLLGDLLSSVLADEDKSSHPDIRSKTLEVALSGWHGACESRNDLLTCEACSQRIGLWMYQPDYKAGRTSSEDTDDDNADDTDTTIELIEMHREHCPWRNADTQAAAGEYAGLNASDILWRVVSRSVKEQRRRSEEQAKAASRHVEDVQAQAAVGGKKAPAEEDVDEVDVEQPHITTEETVRLDKERESRLKRLKRVFTIKKSKTAAKAAN